jgi:hypothetical protein
MDFLVEEAVQENIQDCSHHELRQKVPAAQEDHSHVFSDNSDAKSKL